MGDCTKKLNLIQFADAVLRDILSSEVDPFGGALLNARALICHRCRIAACVGNDDVHTSTIPLIKPTVLWS